MFKVVKCVVGRSPHCTGSLKWARNLCEISSQKDAPGRKPVGLDGKNWRDLRKKQKMGNDKWKPNKRLSWHQIEHLRTLKRMRPQEWPRTKLAQSFGISIPAVSRILRSKFEPSSEIKERQDKRAKEQNMKRREEFLEKLYAQGSPPPPPGDMGGRDTVQKQQDTETRE